MYGGRERQKGSSSDNLSIEEYEVQITKLLIRIPFTQRLLHLLKGTAKSKLENRERAEKVTLAILPQFGSVEKRSVVTFLHSAGLINRAAAVLSMKDADLVSVDFNGIELTGIDLGDANLSNAVFDHGVLQGIELSGANLRGASLKNATFVEADLKGANLNNAVFDGGVLRGAKLSDANLRGASLKNATFVEADLKGANLSESDLSAVDLSLSNLYGANFDNSILNRAKLAKADLSFASFKHACLCDVDLTGADLVMTDFTDSDLSGADLSHATFGGTIFKNAKLSNVRLAGTALVGVKLTGIDLSNATLDEIQTEVSDPLMFSNVLRADFSWSNLTNAKLRHADLSRGIFHGANLTMASLAGSSLKEANLRDADLTSADLSGADLCKADLFGAIFQGTNLSGAQLNPADQKRLGIGEVHVAGTQHFSDPRLDNVPSCVISVPQEFVAATRDFVQSFLGETIGLRGLIVTALWGEEGSVLIPDTNDSLTKLVLSGQIHSSFPLALQLARAVNIATLAFDCGVEHGLLSLRRIVSILRFRSRDKLGIAALAKWVRSMPHDDVSAVLTIRFRGLFFSKNNFNLYIPITAFYGSGSDIDSAMRRGLMAIEKLYASLENMLQGFTAIAETAIEDTVSGTFYCGERFVLYRVEGKHFFPVM